MPTSGASTAGSTTSNSAAAASTGVQEGVQRKRERDPTDGDRQPGTNTTRPSRGPVRNASLPTAQAAGESRGAGGADKRGGAMQPTIYNTTTTAEDSSTDTPADDVDDDSSAVVALVVVVVLVAVIVAVAVAMYAKTKKQAAPVEDSAVLGSRSHTMANTYSTQDAIVIDNPAFADTTRSEDLTGPQPGHGITPRQPSYLQPSADQPGRYDAAHDDKPHYYQAPPGQEDDLGMYSAIDENTYETGTGTGTAAAAMHANTQQTRPMSQDHPVYAEPDEGPDQGARQHGGRGQPVSGHSRLDGDDTYEAYNDDSTTPVYAQPNQARVLTLKGSSLRSTDTDGCPVSASQQPGVHDAGYYEYGEVPRPVYQEPCHPCGLSFSKWRQQS